jgi:hypothetical protein
MHVFAFNKISKCPSHMTTPLALPRQKIHFPWIHLGTQTTPQLPPHLKKKVLLYSHNTFLYLPILSLTTVRNWEIRHITSHFIFRKPLLTIQRLFQPPLPQKSPAVIGVAIFSKRAEKETFVEDRDRTQERIKKEGIFAYGCTVRRYVGRNAEGGGSGRTAILLKRPKSQSPSLHCFSPRSNSSNHVPYSWKRCRKWTIDEIIDPWWRRIF